MTGHPQQPDPMQPYGTQNPAPPPMQHMMPRREGSMAPKVWGIILLILGALGLMMIVMNMASMLGGGMKASTFSVSMSPEAKEQMDRLTETIVQSAMHRWSFWANGFLEVAIALLSLWAGFRLAVQPTPKGRKLAIARALVVLLALPVYGYESMTATDESMGMVGKLQEVQIKDIVEQQEKENPSNSPEERQKRQERATRAVQQMQPFMKGVGYGMVILIAIGVLILNGLLLFFMTRPKVKDYMDHVHENVGEIPGFDPSMGIAGPPPGTGPPHPGQPSPANQPPPPPEQQTPPV